MQNRSCTAPSASRVETFHKITRNEVFWNLSPLQKVVGNNVSMLRLQRMVRGITIVA